MPIPRTLALDIGDRRIGLAITDELGLTAQPLFTLHRASPSAKRPAREDLKAIARFIRQHRVEVLLIGNPLHADGTPSPQSEKVRAFTEALRAHLQQAHPSLTWHLVDERLTTRAAHELLDHAGHTLQASKSTRLTREEQIDQIAATLLLEAWMSHQNGPTLLPE